MRERLVVVLLALAALELRPHVREQRGLVVKAGLRDVVQRPVVLVARHRPLQLLDLANRALRERRRLLEAGLTLREQLEAGE